MDRKEFDKALMLCLGLTLFFVFTLFFTNSVFKNIILDDDAQLHFSMANPLLQSELEQGKTSQYPLFWRTISTPFASNVQTFLFFHFFLFLFLFPILIVLYLRSWLFAFFYFAFATPYSVILTGFFPQLFLTFLLIPFIFTKRFNVRAIILFFSFFVHTYGFVLFLVIWLIILATKYLHKEHIAFACFPLLGDKIKALSGIMFPSGLALNDLLRILLRDLNFFLIGFGLTGFWFKKRLDLILIFIFLFLSALILNPRIIYIASVLLCIGLVWFIQINKVKWLNHFVLFLSLSLILYNSFIFFNDFFNMSAGGC